jgi:photoactive yellow protein
MLDDLDNASLDELPFGVVCLNESMQVLRFNRTEAAHAGIQQWRAIGRDFFMDIAPGPSNRALAEHIRAFASATRAQTAVSHTFHRRAGADPTTIELSRGRDERRVYLKIRRS